MPREAGPRGPQPRDPTFTDEELRRIVSGYVTETVRATARNLGRMIGARVRLGPSPKSSGGLIVESHRDKRGATKIDKIVVLPGRHRAGRKSIPRYDPDDEFWPMLEWAAHLISLRMRKAWLRRTPLRTLMSRFAVSEEAAGRASMPDPRGAIPFIIRDLRGIDIGENQRVLEKYRAAWRNSDHPGNGRREDWRRLEQLAGQFIAEDRRAGFKALPPSRRPSQLWHRAVTTRVG
jgi:hypothetical protein